MQIRGNNMERICIHSKLYDYSVELIDDVLPILKSRNESTAFVIDHNVYSLYRNLFSDVDPQLIYIMEAVEHKKNMDTVMEMIRFLKSIGVRKNWKVYCFGGGITQDVTTITCNLYLRNVEWVFFPTTLLSMVDSCIGGKCGINLDGYKNQIGVFYPPHKIYIDTGFLDSLQRQDHLNGWGEILKFSLTRDPAFFERIKQQTQFFPCEHIKQFIYLGLLTKKDIIEEDEFESDLRRILNYGHTFGHALEAYTDNVIPHGEAVIWGIDVANYYSYKNGLIDQTYYYEIKSFIKRAFLPEEIVIETPDVLFDTIRTDKKVRGDSLSFALLDGKSHLSIYPMKIDVEMKSLFYSYLEETHEYYRD